MLGEKELGTILMTKAVQERANKKELLKFLDRYRQKDWGDIPSDEKSMNNRALKFGGKLIAAYKMRDDSTVFFVTEANRSVTTICFAEDL